MKNLNRFSRKCFAYATLFSLLNSPTYAQEARPAVNPNIKQGVDVANVFINTVGNVLLSQKEAQRKAAAQAQAEKLRVSLSPACQANGKSCYTVQSKYFPQCPIPASMANLPQNVCSVSMDDAQRVNNQAYAMLGGDWINYYNQMMNEASNMSVPFGLKCLQEQQKKLDSQLTEMVNNLTRLQDQLNRDKEIFSLNHKKLLNDLDSNYQELMGAAGNGGNNLALKTKNFFAQFPVNCQGILGEDLLKNGPNLGLLEIKKALESPVSKSNLYTSNRPAIRSEIERDIANFQRAIKSGGVEDFIQGKRTDDSKYGAVKETISKQSQDYVIAKNRIAAELQKYGETLPSGSKTIENDFEEYIKRFQDREKRKFVNDCVTGADKSGVAIPLSDVLKALRQKSTGSAGNATSRYRATIEQIMKSDDSMEEKLKKIEGFEKDNKYVDMSVEYTNPNGQKIIETPYNLYMKTLAACEQKFNSTGDSIENVVSQKKKIERGKALLQEYKALNDSYASNLSNAIQERIFSCDGKAKQAGGSCTVQEGQKVFDATNPDFCMNHADECANEMAGCLSVASKHVQEKETKVKSLINTFNVSAKNVTDRSNQLYTQQKNAAMSLIKQLQAQFPGTNFQIPEDMSISMPELKTNRYGVPMFNDGDLKFLDEFPKKIDLLKKLFTNQQKVLNDEIQDYISKQVSAMEREKGRWEAFSQTCKSAHEASEKQVQDYNNAGMERQAKEDDKVSAFCRKYHQARENPLEACDEAKSLAQDADKIAARLTNSALSYTMNFKNICNSVNNEKDSVDDCDWLDDNKEKEKRGYTAIQRCERMLLRLEKESGKGGKAGKKVKLSQLCGNGSVDDGKFIENLSNKLKSPEDKEKLKGKKSIQDLTKVSFELSDEAQDFVTNFVKPLSAYPTTETSGNSICSKATSVQDMDTDEVQNTSKPSAEKIAADKKVEDAKETHKISDKAAISAKEKIAKAKSELEKFDPTKVPPNLPAEEKVKVDEAHRVAKLTLEQAEKDGMPLISKAEADAQALKIAQEAANKISDDDSTSKSKAKLVIRLKEKIATALKAISEPDKDKIEIAEMKLSDLGEQAENTCDSQASRALGKSIGAPGSIYDPNFDKSILGR